MVGDEGLAPHIDRARTSQAPPEAETPLPAYTSYAHTPPQGQHNYLPSLCSCAVLVRCVVRVKCKLEGASRPPAAAARSAPFRFFKGISSNCLSFAKTIPFDFKENSLHNSINFLQRAKGNPLQMPVKIKGNPLRVQREPPSQFYQVPSEN